ncbi:Sjogren's syndrome/scleroderma autoantigen 1 family protein [Negativicoccus succinicivorans]
MDYRYCPYCGTPLVTKTDKEPPRLYCPHCEKFCTAIRWRRWQELF